MAVIDIDSNRKKNRCRRSVTRRNTCAGGYYCNDIGRIFRRCEIPPTGRNPNWHASPYQLGNTTNVFCVNSTTKTQAQTKY